MVVRVVSARGPLPKKITLGCDVFWGSVFVSNIIYSSSGKRLGLFLISVR